MLSTRHRMTEKFLELEVLAKAHEKLRVEAILAIFSESGLILLTLLLSLPFLQPIPLVGLSTPMGIWIGLNGLAIGFRRSAWLPLRIRALQIPSRGILAVCHRSEKVWSWVERWSRPRFFALVEPSFVRVGLGMVLFLTGMFLALPLPVPGTNILPAFIIFLVGIGILERDGLLSTLGVLLFFGASFAFGGLIWTLVQRIL